MTDPFMISQNQQTSARSSSASARLIKLLRDLFAAVAVSILFLGMTECALRLADVKFEGSFYKPDRELGYALRPNAHGWNVAENETYFQVNSDGMADREHTLSRPPGVIRIAIVGDSVSEAKQVARDQAYWSVIQRRLSNQHVEVLNFGVAGYSLAQESIVIEQRVWKYDPQIIVLAGTIESFILRSARSLSPNKASEHPPFYILNNGVLQLDAQTLQERAAFHDSGRFHNMEGDLMNSSRLLSLLNEGVKKAHERILSKLGRASDPDANVSYQETDCLLGPARPDLKAAWEVSEALILRSRDAAAKHHADLWLFTLDMPEQVEMDPNKRAALERKLSVMDLFLTDRLIADFASANGIHHGTLAPGLLAYAETHHTVLHGFTHIPRNVGHANQIGHRLMGEMIANQLLQSSPLFRNQAETRVNSPSTYSTR